MKPSAICQLLLIAGLVCALAASGGAVKHYRKRRPAAVGQSIANYVPECGEARRPPVSTDAIGVVGGHEAEPGQFPHQVRLEHRNDNGDYICGGIVLDATHILSSGHCLAGVEPKYLRAVVGIINREKEKEAAIVLNVSKITVHEDFYPYAYDIGIVETSQPMKFSITETGVGSVNRPCLPSGRVNYTDAAPMLVSGWGMSELPDMDGNLRWAWVPHVGVAKCKLDFIGDIEVTDDQVCAGAFGKDKCFGDSGGPLVRLVDGKYELVGIVSIGIGCGEQNHPGVYTRASSYLKWIQEHL